MALPEPISNKPPPPGFQIPDLSSEFPGLNIPDINLGAGNLIGPGTRGDKSGKLTPLDPNALEKLAVQADTLGYGLSDQDFAARFPWLAKGREAEIASADTNLAGKTDPFMTKALKQSGLSDINFGQGEYTQARNLGEPILAKENRDRSYFSRLLSENPQRSFGLNAGDIARIAMANTAGVNMVALGLAQGRVNQALSNINTQAQSEAGMISAIGQLGAAGLKAFGNQPNYTSPQLNLGYYNNFTNPYAPNFYSNQFTDPTSPNYVPIDNTGIPAVGG